MATLWIISCMMMGHNWKREILPSGKTILRCTECDTIKRLD